MPEVGKGEGRWVEMRALRLDVAFGAWSESSRAVVAPAEHGTETKWVDTAHALA